MKITVNQNDLQDFIYLWNRFKTDKATRITEDIDYRVEFVAQQLMDWLASDKRFPQLFVSYLFFIKERPMIMSMYVADNAFLSALDEGVHNKIYRCPKLKYVGGTMKHYTNKNLDEDRISFDKNAKRWGSSKYYDMIGEYYGDKTQKYLYDIINSYIESAFQMW